MITSSVATTLAEKEAVCSHPPLIIFSFPCFEHRESEPASCPNPGRDTQRDDQSDGDNVLGTSGRRLAVQTSNKHQKREDDVVEVEVDGNVMMERNGVN